MDVTKKKTNVARLSIFSNTLLIVLKTVVGIFTGSVSVISEAIHSSMDLLAAIIAYFSVKVSGRPADDKHPFGHGKYENLSGVIEALLIFVAAIWIIYESIHKIMNPSTVEGIGWGALVMFISAIVNIIVSRKLYKVAKETDSVALEADALHLKADVFTSIGVAAGLFLLWLTGFQLLDPLVAILVALFILREAYELLMKALTPMLDQSWKKEEINTLNEALAPLNIDYHDVKTRKAGSSKFVIMHLNVDGSMTVTESHELCDHIEKKLDEVLPGVIVEIHVEPKDI